MHWLGRSALVAVRVDCVTQRKTIRGYGWPTAAEVRNAVSVTTPGDLDERFRGAVAEFTGPTAGSWPAAEPEPADHDAGGDARPAAPVRDASEPLRAGARLTCGDALTLFEAQIASRHLDLAARWLRSFNEGYYTIGSSGHEGNAAVAARRCAHRSRPAALPVRCVLLRTGRRSPAATGRCHRDVLRGLVASAREPIAGGRHKVFGHADLARHPDDLDDRVASAARGRSRLRDLAPGGRGERAAVRRRDRGRVESGVAGRRGRDLLVR